MKQSGKKKSGIKLTAYNYFGDSHLPCMTRLLWLNSKHTFPINFFNI